MKALVLSLVVLLCCLPPVTFVLGQSDSRASSESMSDGFHPGLRTCR